MMKLRRIILVHGAGAYGGKSNLFNLMLYSHIPCLCFRYGLVLTVWGWWHTRSGAELLSKVFLQGDLVISHSHGALVADRAMRRYRERTGVPSFISLIALSPALEQDYTFSDGWDAIDVFYNPGDKLSWYASHIPWPFPAHEWGSMMSTGILGRDIKKNEHNYLIPRLVDNVDAEHGNYLVHPLVNKFAHKLFLYIKVWSRSKICN